MQPSAPDHVGIQLPRPLDQAGQHPVAVPEQRGVGRPVDVRLHRRGVEPQRVPRDPLLADRVLRQAAVGLLPGLGANRIFELAERREVHHGLARPRSARTQTPSNPCIGASSDGWTGSAIGRWTWLEVSRSAWKGSGTGNGSTRLGVDLGAQHDSSWWSGLENTGECRRLSDVPPVGASPQDPRERPRIPRRGRSQLRGGPGNSN